MSRKRAITTALALVGDERAVTKLARTDRRVNTRAAEVMAFDEARFALHRHRAQLTVAAGEADATALIAMHERLARAVNGSPGAAHIAAQIEDLVVTGVTVDLAETIES